MENICSICLNPTFLHPNINKIKNMSFAIPPDYGWVLLSASIMGFTCLAIGFIFAATARIKIFNKEFLEKNFGEQHKKALGQQIKKDGFPDSGSGLYSSKLSYKDWYTLNNGQRAHLNFVEMIATNLVLLLVSGLYSPICAALMGAGITVSRVVYAIGYRLKGPNGRFLGVIFNDLFTFAQFVMAIMASFKIINSGVVASNGGEL